MKVLFRESFVRDLRRIEDQDVLRRIRQAVESVEQATNLLGFVRALHRREIYRYFP